MVLLKERVAQILEEELFGEPVRRVGAGEVGYITHIDHKDGALTFRITYPTDRPDEFIGQNAIGEVYETDAGLGRDELQMDADPFITIRIPDEEAAGSMGRIFTNIGPYSKSYKSGVGVHGLYSQKQLDMLRKLGIAWEEVKESPTSPETEKPE